MIAITGGERSVDGVLQRTSAAPTTEAPIAAALLACTARWGLAKTTIDDIAREAGVSRATVYRLYPGGKAAISNAASNAEVVRLSVDLAEGLRATIAWYRENEWWWAPLKAAVESRYSERGQ